jgi:hypothetical protein
MESFSIDLVKVIDDLESFPVVFKAFR